MTHDERRAAVARAVVLSDIRAERVRQVVDEGFTPAHDDKYSAGEMAAAAAAYAFSAYTTTADRYRAADARGFWPWAASWWKPRGARWDLVRAAALIVAEIERLDRLDAEAARAVKQ